MQATIENLFSIYPALSKSDRSKIIRTYCTRTQKSDDTFSRRMNARKFPAWEKNKLKEVLEELFPEGFPEKAQVA